jgi:hypothetical protein
VSEHRVPDPVAESRRRTIRLARAGAGLIVAGAFALSFAALRALAAKAHIPEQLTYVWPVIVDLATVIATAAVLSLSGRDDAPAVKARRYFQWVLGGTVLVSIAGNALHSYSADKPLAPWAAAAVAIVPPIVLLVATHGVTILGGVAHAPEPSAEFSEEPAVVTAPAVIDDAPRPCEAFLEEPVGREYQGELLPAPRPASSPARRAPGGGRRDPELVALVHQLRAKGEPVEAIAAQLDKSTRTITRYLAVEVEEVIEPRASRRLAAVPPAFLEEAHG